MTEPDIVFENTKIPHIKLRHRLWLWLFPMQHKTGVDQDKKCTIGYKMAFGHMYVLSEHIEVYNLSLIIDFDTNWGVT